MHSKVDKDAARAAKLAKKTARAQRRQELKERVATVRENVVAKLPSKSHKDKIPLKITNDTIAEHREQILAGGRKFKYPVQYSKHKILVNTIIIAVAVVIAFGVWLWAMLYRAQVTDDFYYSATQIVPLPVANVDGQNVPYSSYLRRIRADIFYYENQENKSFNTTDGQRELSYNKRQELDAAEKTAYAYKIANSKKITVSDAEANAEIAKQRAADGSDEASFERMLKTYYNWTIDEYRATIRDQLLTQKVAFAIDTTAKNRVAKVEQDLKGGQDFATVAKNASDDPLAKQTGGTMVAHTGDLDSNGLIAAARQLKPGQISGAIAGRNSNGSYCYFIVRLNSETDDETNYSVIQINLTQFDNDFAKLQSSGKIREYISVPSDHAVQAGGQSS